MIWLSTLQSAIIGYMTKERVLEILLSQDGKTISGEALAKDIGVSRMAVSKAVASLREDGYPVKVAERKGYSLTSFDLFMKDFVISALSDVIKVYYYDSLKGSSNNEAKAIAATNKEPFCVVTRTQGGGKGRLGRSFSSPDGGLYFSIYLPSEMLSDGDLITTNAALAVALALEEETGHPVDIKWVNDLYINGKKFTGILTEGIVDLELGGLDGAIIGIGINVNTSFCDYPEDLRGIITTLKEEYGHSFDRLSILRKAVSNVIAYQKKDYLSEYKRRCFILGSEITVNRMGKKRMALAKDIDERARLVVEYEDGSREALSSAEVSLHNS